MTTTTDHPPMRPRGAARHAANATAALGADQSDTSDTSEATGTAVCTPAVPVSTSAQTAPPLPSRRELRPESRTARPGDLGRAVTQAITVPLRTIGSAVASAKAVPVTATAVVACLFVSVATPQTAMASTPQGMLPALDAQQYTASAGTSITVERDAFAIGKVPVRTAPAVGTAAPSKGSGASSVRPVAGSIPAAGGFGSRWVQGCAACSTNHQGLDFAAPTGTAVVAAMSGRVVSAAVFGGYGNQVLLQHADGSQTRYGHLSQIGVRVGQTVTAGQRIGAVGNTGVSTGSHLHFEVVIGGTPVNPAAWLQNRGLL
ncbi:M23 family metallopeptidase [Curtobacterium pusillum]|uniref:M23 family metallopeptidase n=1 Tax=Curtobacterium pusillum TaxID=69373 RepID=UPI00380BF43F